MNKSLSILSLICEGTYDYKKLKASRLPLEPEEREKVFKAKALWHFAPGGKPSSAIWKSKDSSGNIVYGCNTHRAVQIKPTLGAAINSFKFIKTTA